MGLISTALGSVGSTLKDQYKEYFYCDSLSEKVLVTKGQPRNGKGSDNIISNGSVVAVADGQAMMIVDQGKIAEFCAEPGEFVYDESTEPSIFSGPLGEGILNTFKTMGRRFTFGADTGKDQRVYYVNTKEIIGNKYGTQSPVPFRVVDERARIDIDISIRCNGEYSYRICDPMLFYTNVCGNVTGDYTRDKIDSMLKTELLTALQPAFAKISLNGVRYSQLPAHTMELSDALNEILSEKWQQIRGLEIVSFGINTVSADPEDEKMLKDMQRNAAYTDSTYANAALVGAKASAMQAAASNTNGAVMGFMGMNAAMGADQSTNAFLAQQGSAPAAAVAQNVAPAAGSWTCSCGQTNTGKFCSACGNPKPAPAGAWTCSCGTQNNGKFCSNCGKPAPAAEVVCTKCGFKPDPASVPKFCPECGTPFNA